MPKSAKSKSPQGKAARTARVKSPSEIIAELENLAEEYEDDHTDTFLSYIDHLDVGVRTTAVRCLWEARLPDVWEPLKRKAESDPDEEVRSTAISVMGRYVYEEMLAELEELDEDELDAPQELLTTVHQTLVGYLNDPSLSLLLRRRALEAVSYLPEESELALMRAWVVDSNPELRMTAIFAMGRSSMPEFEPIVLRALNDPELDVKREAIRAIGEGTFEGGIPQLLSLVRGADRELMFEAVSALGEVGGEAAIAELERLNQSDDEELAELAELALLNAQEQQMFQEYGRTLAETADDADEDDEDDEELDEDGEKPFRPLKH